MNPRASLRALASLPLVLLCATHPVQDPQRALPFEILRDRLPAELTMPIHHVFADRAEYEAFLGRRSSGVDFERESVVLYSAGLQEGGHHEASILSIRLLPDTGVLEVTTLLDSDLCQVVPEPELPYVLAKFPLAGAKMPDVAFEQVHTILACGL